MAQGYEGWIGFAEQYQGWGNGTHLPLRNFLEPESETLDLGINENRRENKIRGRRHVRLGDVSNDIASPTGGVVLQPRTDEMAALLAAHCHSWHIDPAGTNISGAPAEWEGTIVFVPSGESPNFTGSTWGSFDPDTNIFTTGDIYPLRMFKTFGSVEETNAHAAISIPHGYVESLEWAVTWETDLMVTPTFNFRGTNPSEKMLGAIATVVDNAVSPFNLRFSGWNATITLDGTANTELDVEEWGMTQTAGGAGAGRVGAYGPARFPFSNTPSDIGNMLMEFKSAKWMRRNLSGTGTFQFVIRFENNATEWMEIRQEHCRFKPLTPQNSGADSRIDTAFDYEAFGSAGTPSTFVTLYTKYATSAFSLDVFEGTGRVA